jgi:NADP-dependent 3-hydroxy acid dehydrogenase YdfG
VEKDIEALIAHALETFGRLDCMFNNAGTRFGRKVLVKNDF